MREFVIDKLLSGFTPQQIFKVPQNATIRTMRVCHVCIAGVCLQSLTHVLHW